MNGILSSTLNIGNSDIIGEFAYHDTDQLVDTIQNMKHMDGVGKVTWSEEVYRSPISEENSLKSYTTMLGGRNSETRSLSSDEIQ